MLPTAVVLDLPVHLSANYAEFLVQLIAVGNGGHVITINAEMAMLARQEHALSQLISKADLVVPDGAGVVWALQRQGKQVRRCAGVDLVEAVLKKIAQSGKRVYFLGAAPGVAALVAERWSAALPGLEVCGFRDGFFKSQDQENLVAELQTARPDLLLVGLGVPRQEYWIDEMRKYLPSTVFVGVGGSFDIWSGTKERAPKWLRENYLEWLYRLYKEPWRAKRMLALPKFALAVLKGA
ncbi:MAG: WecB/TagA/CpsF family glycosyltransferase [Anaerolineae bacterium]|nr:WecB/TagA/CpsF family glycosyltransferase [Gloeobacterales cyanobacterium ES-bin-313]